MRKVLLLFITIIGYSVTGFSQTFYVEPTGKGFEKKITEKLKYDGHKVVDQKSESDYTLTCLITQTSKINSMYKGCLRINDSKTGKEVSRTKEVRRGAVAVNGFNAGNNIFQVIADKYLEEEIKKVSK